jgi:hypothetical protein
MSTRAALALWILLGAAVWNGFLDIYVSRGAREYLEKRAEFELGRVPEPRMADVMANASRDGVVAGSLWAATIVAAGVATTCWTRRG